MKWKIFAVVIVCFLIGVVSSQVFAEAPTLDGLMTVIGPCKVQVKDADKVLAVIEFLEKERSVRPSNVSLSHINLAVSYMIAKDVLAVENQLKNSPNIDPKMIKALQDRLDELDNQLKDGLAKLGSQMTIDHQQINKKLVSLAGDIDKLSAALNAILGEQQKQIDCLLDKVDAANNLLLEINDGVNSANSKLDGLADSTGRIEDNQRSLDAQGNAIIDKANDIHNDVGYLIDLAEREEHEPDFVIVSLGGFYRTKSDSTQSQLREYCFDANLRLPILGDQQKAIFISGALGNIYAALAAEGKIKVGPIGFLAGLGGNYMPEEQDQWHGFVEAGVEYKRLGILARMFVWEPECKKGVQILFRLKLF